MMNNKVNIERLQKDMEKALNDIEELKDSLNLKTAMGTEDNNGHRTSYNYNVYRN